MSKLPTKPTRQQAEAAVRLLIEWAGDNPEREGLMDTPRRVIDSYLEFFKGYQQDPVDLLTKTFQEITNYDETIILRDIRVESYCEHHMVPIIGKATVAYLPDQRIVGISKIARVVDIFAKRLQIQERLTVQIASAINEVLKPKGVGIIIEASHQCMSTRGVHKPGMIMQTSHMLGCFRDDYKMRGELFSLVSASTAHNLVY